MNDMLRMILGIFAMLMAVVALMWLLALYSSAEAQQPQQQPLPKCGPWKELIGMYQRQYQEKSVARGMSGDAQSFVVIASRRGTWTAFTIDMTTSVACAVASGNQWRSLEQLPGREAV
jgi:hypothetical protein